MSPTGVTVAVIGPPRKKESDDQRAVREAIVDRSQKRQWSITPLIRTTEIGYLRGPNAGRKVQVLIPQDVRDIYKLAHKRPLAVLAITSFRVRPDPSADPAPDKALWRASEFLRFKAHVVQVRDIKNLDAVLDEAETSLDGLSCDGPRDPRVLPMHVFSPGGHRHDLSMDTGRTAFTRNYGHATSRTDDRGRVWKHGPDHGRDILIVAGTVLPAGFHWDVTKPSGGKTCKIANGWVIWELTGRRGYANVAPDAAVRRGNNECVSRWPPRR